MAISKCSVQTKKPVPKDKPQAIPYSLKESVFHGTVQFPLAIYEDNIAVQEVSWHWHEEFEVGFVTEGNVMIGSGSRKYLLQKGNGFFINSGVIHAVKNGNAPYPAALKSIVFHHNLIGGAAGSIFESEYVLPIFRNPEFPEYIFRENNPYDANMVAKIAEAWQAVYKEETTYPLVARNALSQLFADLISVCVNNPVSGSVNVIREKRTQSMLAFIHDHYSELVTLQDIANAAFISTSEALRCFRQIVGLSPMQYLKKYRLARAAHLLQDGTYSVSEVCSLCGFQDHSYFTRSFREVYGYTPSKYSITLK